jgi:hypothetical protein
LEFGALIAARLAKLGAQVAEVFCFFTAQAHKPGCSIAYCGALHTQLDACGQLMYFRLAGTQACIIITCSCTTQACFDARLILVKTPLHNFWFYVRNTLMQIKKSHRERIFLVIKLKRTQRQFQNKDKRYVKNPASYMDA